ncbi:MAG: ACT domain-containing protein, partial [Armatimonadota bacterium]
MTVRKATGFTVEVDDRTGVLAEMAQPVAEAGINLLALYGGPAGAGKAKICCVPENPDS